MEALTNNVLDCALVFEGGGYRESYTAGIANVLLEQGIHFDYICGLSAGASNTVNYISRDPQRIKDSFMIDARTRKAVGWHSIVRGKGYFDADAIYQGSLVNNALPFDWETFAANPAHACIQTFERDTGRTRRFNREDITDLSRLLEIIRASSTLPGAMLPLPVDGRVLYDGGMGEGAGIPVCMAEDDGFSRFFFVATRPKGYRKKPPTEADKFIYGVIARKYPYLRKALLTRWKRYNAALEHVEKLAEEGKALIIYPDEMNVSSSTINSQKLEDAYADGHAQGLREVGRWRTFLFGAPDAGPAPVDIKTPQADNYVTIG